MLLPFHRPHSLNIYTFAQISVCLFVFEVFVTCPFAFSAAVSSFAPFLATWAPMLGPPRKNHAQQRNPEWMNARASEQRATDRASAFFSFTAFLNNRRDRKNNTPGLEVHTRRKNNHKIFPEIITGERYRDINIYIFFKKLMKLLLLLMRCGVQRPKFRHRIEKRSQPITSRVLKAGGVSESNGRRRRRTATSDRFM